MSTIDIIVGVMLIFGAVSGYQKGFLEGLFSLLAIILGTMTGFKLMGYAMMQLAQHYAIDEKVLPYVAFGIVFVIVVILVSLIGKLIKSSLEKTVLGSADKAMGALLGAVKTAFMLSVLLWITDSLQLSLLPEHWLEEAWLYPTIAKFAPELTHWVSEFIPVFSNLFSKND